ncbi:MAG: IPExxxVDY family protein [Flavobacteriales bacterium]|nr:IPExxxVDY family protein [Flavobacteriales bacterium]MCZ2444071.1 IPExxxVDY family protein [Flavobacteriales bacterium]
MEKLRLDISSEDIDAIVIGITCHEPDYRLAWALNHNCGFSFERYQDFISPNASVAFPMYQHDEEELMRTHWLIANRFNGESAIPVLSQIDYIFITSGAIEDINAEHLIEQIHQIDFVLLANLIDIDLIKNNDSLLTFL